VDEGTFSSSSSASAIDVCEWLLYKEDMRERSGALEAREIGEKSPDDQFEHPDVLEISGERIEVHDLVPEKQKSDVPVLVAPGWAFTPRGMKYSLFSLVEAGRRAISVNAPHGVEKKDLENSPMAEPLAELRRVEAIMRALEQKQIDKVDVIAHSEGGLYTAIAATLYPEKFRNLILVNPAGMIGKDNLLRLGAGFTANATIEILRRVLREPPKEKNAFNLSEYLKTIFSEPRKSFEEIQAVSQSDIREMLEGLRARGIRVAIIHTVDDKGFPMDRMQQAIGEHPGGWEKMMDGFASVAGTHNEMVLRPEKYTRAAETLLTALEAKQAKEDEQKRTP